jgi:hypothetical protein
MDTSNKKKKKALKYVLQWTGSGYGSAVGSVVGSYELCNSFGFCGISEISWPTEQILTSQVLLYCVQFASEYFSYNQSSESEKNTVFTAVTPSSLVDIYRGFGEK